MRRIFSTVLVLMLVLRGLLGDAMAMGLMAGGGHGDVPASQHAAGESHAAAPTHANHAMHANLDEPLAASESRHDSHSSAHATQLHEASAAPAARHASTSQADASSMAHCASADAQRGATSDCDSSQHAHCAACGICHSPLGTWASLGLPHAAPAQVAPMGSLPAFASAVLAQVAKPPIS